MKHILILFAGLLLFTGCITQNKCNRKFPPEVMIIRKDSIFRETKTIIRDTTIYYHLPADTVMDSIKVYIDRKTGFVNSEVSHLSNKYANSLAWISKSQLHHKLMQNDTSIQITIKDAIQTTWSSAERFYNQSETKIVEKKFVPLFYKLLSWVGAIALIYLIVKAVLFVKKLL